MFTTLTLRTDVDDDDINSVTDPNTRMKDQMIVVRMMIIVIIIIILKVQNSISYML